MKQLLFNFFTVCALCSCAQNSRAATTVSSIPHHVKGLHETPANAVAMAYQHSGDSAFYNKLLAPKDVAHVLELMRRQENSWNSGDVHGFMEHYWHSDSLKFIGSKGVTYGWQKTLDNYIKNYPTKAAMGVLKFSIIEASQLSPTSIYIIGKWELAKEKPAGGHFTLLWKKIDEKWVIVSDHTS